MRTATSAIILCLAALAACAKDRPAPAFPDIKSGIATPHTDWANPLDGGPIRVLIVAPRYTLRDAVELAERIEIAFDAVPACDRDNLDCPGETSESPESPGPQALLNRLLEEPHDAIIIANMDLHALSVDAQSAIFRNVAAGTGLVLANHDPAEGLVFETFLDALQTSEDTASLGRGLGETITPEWYGAPQLVEAATYGEGRVVQLLYGADRPATHCLIPALANPIHAMPGFFDTYLSLVARSIRWAAHREGGPRVKSVSIVTPAGPPEDQIPPELPDEFVKSMYDSVELSPVRAFDVSLDAPTDRDYQVKAQLRDPDRELRVEYTNLPELKKGSDHYSLEVLAGPGDYLLDLWFSTKKGVAQWHTEAVRVSGWPMFTDLRLSKQVLLPHDMLDMAMNVTEYYGRGAQASIYARAIDSFGRLVAESYQQVPEGGGHVAVRMSFADLIAEDIKLEVFALNGAPHVAQEWELNTAASEVRLLHVRHIRPPGAWAMATVAPAAYEYNARRYLEILRDHGLTAAHTDAGDAAHRFLARMNLRPSAVLSQWSSSPAAETSVRVPCLGDPEFLKQEAERLRDGVNYFSTDGIMDFSLGLGAAMGAGSENTCQCQLCLAGYQERLKREYGSIESLNNAWNTSYANWAAPIPPTLEETRTTGGGPAWTSFRLAMADTFTAAVRMARDTVHGIDKYGRLGFIAETPGAPPAAYDWAALAASVDWIAVEPAPLPAALLRSAKQGATYGFILDGPEETVTEARARWLPWQAALQRANTIWWLHPYGNAWDGAQATALLPDGRTTPAFDRFFESAQPLQEGLAALLLAAERPQPAIAVYQGRQTLYLDALDAGQAEPGRHSAENALRLLDTLGFDYAALGESDLTSGRLADFKVLMLPAAHALAEAQAKAIAAYVSGGGNVIADTMPGTSGQYGEHLAAWPLAQLFGVTPGAVAAPTETTSAPLKIATNAGDRECTLTGLIPDGSVAVSEGAPDGNAGGIPLWITRRETAGRTLLLNHAFPQPDSDTSFPDLFAAYLRDFELTPAVALKDEVTSWPGGQRRRLRYGNADLYMLLRDPAGASDPETVRLQLDRKDEAYDLIAGVPLERAGTARCTLAPGEAALFSRLPYEVESVEIAAPDKVVQGERLTVRVAVNCEPDNPGDHLVWVMLTSVRGQRVACYSRAVACARGRGDTFLPLALNETPGHYYLEARDLLSGTRSRVLVQVIPRAQ